ncbi:MAG: RluA family pseudouridine synthase [Lachnospiraceae bacterium]|nr:RluA family pseudouridine synthase [Lachnospiraceae bacterium]
MQSFIIGKNQAGQRFDKFLVKYLPGAPKSLIYKMLRKKNITLNKKKSDGSEILSVGDSVESFFSDETFEKFSSLGDFPNSNVINANSINASKSNNSSNPSIKAANLSKTGSLNFNSKDSNKKNIIKPTIIYEDENILIADKPAGLLSQKAEPGDYSVNEWLIEYLLDSGKLTKEELKTFKPSTCNRLDRNTSGLIICGISLLGLQKMSEIIRHGNLEKYYVTVCHGKIDKSFKAEGILIKDSAKNKSFIKNISDEDMKANIITDFKPLKYNESATLLEVNLHTGKPHQIRAQLSALGHPIYGDKKYGGNDKGFKHQILCAYRLVFPGQDVLGDDFKYLANKEIKIDFPKEILKFDLS